MTLYVMRHGPAADRAPSGRDFDRPLTPQGREAVANVARALRALRADDPLRVLASPLLRAQQTAEVVRAIAAPNAVIETRDELAADEPPALGLVSELAALGEDALLVGHQPAVEALVRSLCCGAPELASGFRTAMIACLSPHGDDGWTLDGVLI